MELKLRQLPYEKEFNHVQQSQDNTFDTTDIRILQQLLVNSRMKLTELGKILHMSSQNIDVRIKRLITEGIITLFGYRPNYQKLHFQYYTLRLRVSSHDETKKQKLQHYLFTLPQTLFYFRMIGRWTYSIHMFYKDVRELNEFLMELREHFGDIIESYDSTIHLDQYYYSYISRSSAASLLKK